MVRYATNADTTYADRRTIESVLDKPSGHRYGLRSLIHAIAESSFVNGSQR